jgi:hypothetical protein
LTFRYRLHDTTDNDLGTLEHPAPNVEPGDVVVLEDGREALVTARVETDGGQFAALLEVAIAPTPLTSDGPSRSRDGRGVRDQVVARRSAVSDLPCKPLSHRER